MMKLYGVLMSRANRCMWMLEEMGQSYDLVKTTADPDDLQTPGYLRLNPNARMPTLVDGDVVVWESLAINLYLADKYEGPEVDRWLNACYARPAYLRMGEMIAAELKQ